jgi:hypothetical protein
MFTATGRRVHPSTRCRSSVLCCVPFALAATRSVEYTVDSFGMRKGHSRLIVEAGAGAIAWMINCEPILESQHRSRARTRFGSRQACRDPATAERSPSCGLRSCRRNSVRWWRSAAEQGHAAAQLNLGPSLIGDWRCRCLSRLQRLRPCDCRDQKRTALPVARVTQDEPVLG